MYNIKKKPPEIFFLPYWFGERISELQDFDYDDIVDYEKMSQHFSQRDLIEIVCGSEEITINGQRFGNNLMNKWIEKSEEARKIRDMKPFNTGASKKQESKKESGYFITTGNKSSEILYIFMRPRISKDAYRFIKDVMVGLESLTGYENVPLNFSGITSSFISLIINK